MKRSRHSVVAKTYPERSIANACGTVLLLFAAGMYFCSKGPLLIAGLASLVLIGRSIGIRTGSFGKCVPMARASATQLGPCVILHSHYDAKHGRESHEFYFLGKFLCAGCFGIAFGTLLGLTLPVTYFFYHLNDTIYTALAVLAPLCFIPTFLRCLGWRSLNAVERFLSYSLLPIGSWIILILLDNWFHHMIVNLIALGLICLAWHAGGRYKLAQ